MEEIRVVSQPKMTMVTSPLKMADTIIFLMLKKEKVVDYGSYDSEDFYLQTTNKLKTGNDDLQESRRHRRI